MLDQQDQGDFLMGFATDAIHVGQEPEPATGAIVAPIYQTSTYVQEELGKNKGYDYARTAHPNRRALERTVAKLEGGSSAFVFTSGMAAIDSVFRLLRPGDHAIISEAVYGGVIRLTTQFLVQWGLGVQFRGHVLALTCRTRHQTEHQNDLCRDADESRPCASRTSPPYRQNFRGA